MLKPKTALFFTLKVGEEFLTDDKFLHNHELIYRKLSEDMAVDVGTVGQAFPPRYYPFLASETVRRTNGEGMTFSDVATSRMFNTAEGIFIKTSDTSATHLTDTNRELVGRVVEMALTDPVTDIHLASRIQLSALGSARPC